MSVYVRRVNFTTNQNIKLQSLTWMNSQGSTFEKNTHAQSANGKNFAGKRGLGSEICSTDVITHKGHCELSLAKRESFQAKILRDRLSKKQIPAYLKNKCSSVKASVKVTAKKHN